MQHIHVLNEEDTVTIKEVTVGGGVSAGKEDGINGELGIEVKFEVTKTSVQSQVLIIRDYCPDGKGGIVLINEEVYPQFKRNNNGASQRHKGRYKGADLEAQ